MDPPKNGHPLPEPSPARAGELIYPLALYAPEKLRELESSLRGQAANPPRETLNNRKKLTSKELKHELDPARNAPQLPPGPVTQQARTAFWEKCYADGQKSLADLAPFRIAVCWRIVRHFAITIGHIGPNESLFSCTKIHSLKSATLSRDPWTESWDFPSSPTHEVDFDKDTFELATDPCLPLLPPAVTNPAKDYDPDDPRQDPLLHRYIDAFRSAVSFLEIEEGSPLNPDFGRFGLAGLLNPYLIRIAFPSQEDIFGFEKTIITFGATEFRRAGTSGANEYLTQRYGLNDFECANLVSMIKARAARMHSAPIEDEKAAMVLRLEGFIDRAMVAGDRRMELAAYKQLAMVLGLTRTEPENPVRDFAEIIARGSTLRPQALPAAPLQLDKATTNGSLSHHEAAEAATQITHEGY